MKNSNLEWRLLGHVGVDAGVLMVGDPCYFIGPDSTAQKAYPGGWEEFCEKQFAGFADNKEDVTQMDFARGHGGLGVVSGTAYGDGSYPVYGLFRVGGVRCLAMTVVTGDDGDIVDLPPIPGSYRGEEEEEEE